MGPGSRKESERTAEAALGLFRDFGRWTDPVLLVYDPDNAPEQYADTAYMLEILDNAASEWEKVSGIRFLILDPDSSIEDDSAVLPQLQDGLVRVSWLPTDSFAGRASPEYGPIDAAFGYRPFVDGRVELSSDAGSFPDEEVLKRVLVHKLGHLAWLGHAENPNTVMYANPYNRLRHPREDDIRAMQVLYGPPAMPLTPSMPFDEWLYHVPILATQSLRNRLFQPTEELEHGAVFSLRDGGISANGVGQQIHEISETTPDGKLLRFNLGGIDNLDGKDALILETQWILTDPSGYEYKRKTVLLDCAAGSFCEGYYWNFLNTNILKTVPGTWHIHIIDVSNGPGEVRTLLTMPLDVSTIPKGNRAPVVSVDLTDGSKPGSILVQMVVEDFEKDTVHVHWHGGDFSGLMNDVSPGTTFTQELMLSGQGPHTLYLELTDSGGRYEDNDNRQNFGNAGRGFQNIVRIDFTLPVASSAIGIRSAQGALWAGYSDMPLWMAGFGTSTKVIAVSDGVSRAEMTVSASRDGGVTYDALFSRDDDVTVAGSISPDAWQVGEAAEIFIVQQTENGSMYVHDKKGNFIEWNTRLGDLEPAYEIGSLQSVNGFDIFRGNLKEGRSRIYLGYRLLSGGPLLVSAAPWVLEAE
jgi:hypothetical protein